MKFNTKLRKIRTILGLETALEQMKVLDGTIISAESFEVGKPMFIIAEDGTETPALEGTYETDGYVIVVDTNGIILSVTEKEIEMPEVETPVMASEETIEVEENVELSVPTGVTLEEVQNLISPVFLAMEEMAKELVLTKEALSALQEKYSKFSKTPAGSPVPRVNESVEKTDPLEARINKLMSFKKDSN